MSDNKITPSTVNTFFTAITHFIEEAVEWLGHLFCFKKPPYDGQAGKVDSVSNLHKTQTPDTSPPLSHKPIKAKPLPQGKDTPMPNAETYFTAFTGPMGKVFGDRSPPATKGVHSALTANNLHAFKSREFIIDFLETIPERVRPDVVKRMDLEKGKVDTHSRRVAGGSSGDVISIVEEEYQKAAQHNLSKKDLHENITKALNDYLNKPGNAGSKRAVQSALTIIRNNNKR